MGNPASVFSKIVSMKNRTALFPGSFDPITKGHRDIIKKALSIFDHLVVGVGQHPSKKSFFSIEERVATIQKVFENEPNISVIAYTGLTIDFCRKVNAGFIIRGLRSGLDFEYEQSIAFANKEMGNEIETVFLLSSPSYSNISSTIVRDIMLHGGDYSKFVPEAVKYKPEN